MIIHRLCVRALFTCAMGRERMERRYLHYCSVFGVLTCIRAVCDCLCVCGREREKERKGGSLLCSVSLWSVSLCVRMYQCVCVCVWEPTRGVLEAGWNTVPLSGTHRTPTILLSFSFTLSLSPPLTTILYHSHFKGYSCRATLSSCIAAF